MNLQNTRGHAGKTILTADEQRWTKQRNQTTRWGLMGSLKLQQEYLKLHISDPWSHLSWHARAPAVSKVCLEPWLYPELILSGCARRSYHLWVLLLLLIGHCPYQPLNILYISLIISKCITYLVLLFSNIRLPILILISVCNLFCTPPINKWSLHSFLLEYGLALATWF